MKSKWADLSHKEENKISTAKSMYRMSQYAKPSKKKKKNPENEGPIQDLMKQSDIHNSGYLHPKSQVDHFNNI